MTSVAITDHGNMYGAIEFYKEAKKNGIKPIIGCEVYMCNDMYERTLKDNEIYHLTLLAKNEKGYNSLMKLVSKAHLEGFYYKPRLDFKTLMRDGEINDIIVLSGCLGGELSKLILNDRYEEAKKLAGEYRFIFGDNYFIEIQRHDDNKDQCKVAPKLIELAKELDIPMVATGDSHYLHSEEKDLHEVFLAINTGKSLKDKDRMSLKDNDLHVSSTEEMYEKFKDIPEALENTQKIADMCNVEIELDKIRLPKFDVPNGDEPDSYLLHLTFAGLKERGLDNKEYLDRIKYELGVIAKTGFATYLLIVQDFVAWAKSKSIAVGPGRGSAAGSLICYAIGITNVDPIKHGLLFERFLNPERISMPDIDLDFEDKRRNEVIEYVANKYGKDHVAQIITFGSMFARSSIRDTGRALGYDLKTCDRISKMIPFGMSLSQSLEDVNELKEEYEKPESKKLIDTALHFEGVIKHVGKHACGVVISDKPIIDYTPVQYSKDKDIVSQFDMNNIGELGLLKMDFLGLRNLSVISECVNLIKRDYGFNIDINDIPENDKKTFKLLQEAKTTSVFQLESDGMKRYLKKLIPTSIKDIIAMVALYRPGPMELIQEYVDRKHGRSTIEYLHPKLEPVLNETYGIMIYQEQLINSVQELAGFTKAEADVLRKAVGKKIKQLLDEQEVKFKDGCSNNGVSKEIADKFWSLIEPFNKYGFNKSHAACYAMIAYQTAYLKANFPVQFMTAEMNSDTKMDRIKELIIELKDMGIKISAPDINISSNVFVGNGINIRFPLTAIKGMGSKSIDKTLEARGLKPFISLEDFLTRVGGSHMTKRTLEILALSGSLDLFGERAQLAESAKQLAVYSNFEYPELLPELKLRKVFPLKIGKKLSKEKELLGLYVSSNPAKNYHEELKKYGVVELIKLPDTKKKVIRIGGVITDLKKVVTKSGKVLYFIRLSDISSEQEIMIFESVYNKKPEVFEVNNVVVLFGSIKNGKFMCLDGGLINKMA